MIFYLYRMKKRKKNGKGKFGILFPPAVGYSFPLFLNLLKKNRILPRYYMRVLGIVVINIINMPFRAYERKFINPRIAKSKITENPIFIIGHWRSGTTLLHNLLTRDEQMGYVTTYQSVFPDTLFNIAGKFIFKNFTKLLIPGTRKGDNVKLNPDLPQEEEFLLGCAHPFSFYYFWLFPEKIMDYYARYIQFKDVSDDIMINWENDYSLMIKKVLRNLNKSHFISKNPPNTGRIKQLLKLFPDAKFIHIHRNPVEVFLSTRHFFRIMLPHLQLHSINEKQLEESIFIIYKKMMNQLLQDKHLIPENNFIELRFEDLENAPVKELKKIYDHLQIPGFEDASENFNNYLLNSRGYKKNVHAIEKELLDRIVVEFRFTMEAWGYEVPTNIKIL